MHSSVVFQYQILDKELILLVQCCPLFFFLSMWTQAQTQTKTLYEDEGFELLLWNPPFGDQKHGQCRRNMFQLQFKGLLYGCLFVFKHTSICRTGLQGWCLCLWVDPKQVEIVEFIYIEAGKDKQKSLTIGREWKWNQVLQINGINT